MTRWRSTKKSKVRGKQSAHGRENTQTSGRNEDVKIKTAKSKTEADGWMDGGR